MTDVWDAVTEQLVPDRRIVVGVGVRRSTLCDCPSCRAWRAALRSSLDEVDAFRYGVDWGFTTWNDPEALALVRARERASWEAAQQPHAEGNRAARRGRKRAPTVGRAAARVVPAWLWGSSNATANR